MSLATAAVENLGLRQFSSKTTNESVETHCFLINFHRLLKSSKEFAVDSQIKNKEILHAVVALYNSCLPNIEPDVLYSTVCGKNSWTLVVLLSRETALEKLCTDKKCEPDLDISEPSYGVLRNGRAQNDVTNNALQNTDDGIGINEEIPLHGFLKVVQKTYTELEEEKAQEVCPNCRPSKFAGVYSDEEDGAESSSEDESGDEEEDFSEGADEFIAEVARRRHIRNIYAEKTNRIRLSSVHVENRLIAALTYERSFAIPNEKVFHITVLSVRLKFRKLGLGQFLVDEVKSKKDKFDTLAVLADTDAVQFFKKQNFTQDYLICSRYEDLIDTWTDCVIMIYVPPVFDPEKVELEKDLEFVDRQTKFLQDGSLKLYHQQFGLVTQLKNEAIATRKIIDMQKKIIHSLIKEIMSNEENQQTTTSSKN